MGLDEPVFHLEAWQMAVRAIGVYLFAIIVVRLGSRRFIGKHTAFDLLLGIMLGSVLSRGITGQTPLLGCLLAGATLLLMHWVLGAIAYHVKGFGPLIKGQARVLIRDGRLDEKAMAKSHLGHEDLAEALRACGYPPDPEAIHFASLERSGRVSVVPKKSEPRIVEVKVADGVQTVRIEFAGGR